MKITFATRRLEACFRDASLAERAWGSVVGRRYIQRIQILKRMKPADLYMSGPLRFHALHGPQEGSFALTLHDPWRMVVTLEGDTLRVEEVSNHYGD